MTDTPSTAPGPAPASGGRPRLGSPVVVARMALADIPQVVAIDNLSFALPWSDTSYRYELTQNENSHFFVARATHGRAHPSAAPAGGWRARLARWLGPGPAAGPNGAPPVVGYAGYWFVVDEAHISTIAVHPEWRGLGVGEQLLVSLLSHALDLGAVAATLEVRVSNTPAQNLYRKYGFEPVGRRRRYYRDNGEDALLMTAGMRGSYRETLQRRFDARGQGE
jgi:ribosomal-protein-alanine N-acetyltransferase